jgi:hypothetical protein
MDSRCEGKGKSRKNMREEQNSKWPFQSVMFSMFLGNVLVFQGKIGKLQSLGNVFLIFSLSQLHDKINLGKG